MLDAAQDVVATIRSRGRLAFIAGGAVRDLVLGRPLTDVDVATDMPLEELASLFKTHTVGRSREFDTVVITRDGHAFEITRFRRGAALSREPFDPLREDTAHRDFTINALLLAPDGRVIDLQGGLGDLRRRVVRAVGSPEERFAEDPVRVLRAVRFAACLGFTIEAGTAAALAGNVPRLATVAGERLGSEILKMAAQPGAGLSDAVVLMDRFGLLALLLPEVRALKGLSQPLEWHPEGDAWEHTLAALRASASADPAINLAVLLHDVGKFPAHRVEEGRHRYRGHESAGAGLVDAVTRRLFLPQHMRSAIAFASGHHMQAGRLGELRRSKRLALIGSGHWPVLRALALCDVGSRGNVEAAARLDSVFREAEEDAATITRRTADAPVVSGTRIMELTGLPPGPRVGEIQRRVSAWALDNAIEDRTRIAAETLRVAGQIP